MSVSSGALIAARGATGPQAGDEGSAWRAPLVPAALAFTAGVLLDRLGSVPLTGSLVAGFTLLAAFAAACAGRLPGLPLVYLALGCVGLGAAWHHYRRDTHRPDDIGWLDVLALYLLAELPERGIREGEGFRQTEGGDRRILHGVPCTRCPSDDFFFNPYGYWRLEAES